MPPYIFVLECAIAEGTLHLDTISRFLMVVPEQGAFLETELAVFKKDRKDCLVCRRCGYIHEGEAPPKKYPSCDHEFNYFQVKCEEY